MLVRDELLAEDGLPSGWPLRVPRPEWAKAADGDVADTVAWHALIDEVATFLCEADVK